MKRNTTHTSSLLTLILVFFFWGFVAASNDILIPVFKEELHLSQAQAQLISFAFYIAYTVGSVIYYILSKAMGEDILNRMGYKNGIVLGLVISAAGTLLFIPAADHGSFTLMITGLFVVALGFSLQQTAANPLAIVMGDPRKGAQRLSLAGGINNVGTTIGPVLISFAFFGSVASKNTSSLTIESIKVPYLILGAAFLTVALVFKLSSIPNKIESGKNDSPETIAENQKKTALEYPQLYLGMIAIFLYVGVEVSTASNLPEFMKQHLQTPTAEIAPYVSLFWASLMIGRWTSSLGAFNVQGNGRTLLYYLIPYSAFAVFLFVNKIANHSITQFYIYALVILALIVGDLLSKGNPGRQLLIYSFLGITALMVGMLADGMVSVYAFISVGLFCSTLWPCIFTLAIAGLGKHTNTGSGFLVMMIMGGGIISYLQGFLSSTDMLGIQWSYLVGVMCFSYLAFYAWRVSSILKHQGIDYDSPATHKH